MQTKIFEATGFLIESIQDSSAIWLRFSADGVENIIVVNQSLIQPLLTELKKKYEPPSGGPLISPGRSIFHPIDDECPKCRQRQGDKDVAVGMIGYGILIPAMALFLAWITNQL